MAESNIIPSSYLGDLVAAFDHHRSIFGQVDICINNAGVAEKPSDFFYEDKSVDGKGSWRRVMDINLTAVIDGTRLAVRQPLFCFFFLFEIGLWLPWV
jgi:NAD(P)-dependent dehydrogenase (short-subunit alcohol dehydrogenase family)